MANQHSIREQWEREVKPLIGRQGDGVGLGVAIITTDFQDALDGLIEQYENLQDSLAHETELRQSAEMEVNQLAEEYRRTKEQLETARAEAERSEKYAGERDLVAQEFEEQLEAEQGLRRSADAALEAMGERLEHVMKSLDEYDTQRDVAVAHAERLQEQLETMEWFLRHRTADEGMTQWEVYEQIDWSTHPEFASNPASEPKEVA